MLSSPQMKKPYSWCSERVGLEKKKTGGGKKYWRRGTLKQRRRLFFS
jgi:hypothetical protein